MRLILLFFFFTIFSALGQELTSPPSVDLPAPSPLYRGEVLVCGCGMEAQYAGGQRAFSAFVNDHIQFPADVQWGSTSRVRAYVQFIVEKDGSLSDIHILRTNFSEMGEAILTVFGKMTNWLAGEYDCEPGRTRVRVPISIIIR